MQRKLNNACLDCRRLCKKISLDFIVNSYKNRIEEKIILIGEYKYNVNGLFRLVM